MREDLGVSQDFPKFQSSRVLVAVRTHNLWPDCIAERGAIDTGRHLVNTGIVATMPGTRGPVPVPLREGGRDLTQQILDTLDTKEPLKTNEDFADVPQNEIKAALDRLGSRQMLTHETNDAERVLLTPEGQQICDEGSHEYKVWDAVQKKGKIPLKDLPVWQ